MNTQHKLNKQQSRLRRLRNKWLRIKNEIQAETLKAQLQERETFLDGFQRELNAVQSRLQEWGETVS